MTRRTASYRMHGPGALGRQRGAAMVSPPSHPNTRSIPFLAPVTEHDEAWESRACYHPLSKEKRMPIGTLTNPTLAQQLLDALDALSGLHPGFRPAHAKGLMCAGTFTPSPEAAQLTRAPHAHRPSTAVTVRYSNSTGLPTIPDNDPRRSGPRGMAIRFHLAEHDHTDIVAHSTDGFPVRTGEELLGLVRAVTAFAAGQPEALGSFLAAHPNAKRFVEAPKPIPTSFAREAFFAVTAFRFTNANGVSRHGRFRIRPDAGTEYLSDVESARKSGDFLFDEIGRRLAQ